MAAELSPDEVLRAINALEAAWKRDDDALAALGGSGVGKQPLAQLIARYGASAVERTALVSIGAGHLPRAEAELALMESGDGLGHHMLILLGLTLANWAADARDDVQATGALGRSVLQTMLSFGHGDEESRNLEVTLVFAGLRAGAARSRAS
jgi:hypothetical protein